MFGIGAFARLGGVSVRTLHHYDELGLLAPAHVDPDTGYRWYEAEQLARLNRILALRDLGFALGDVGPVLTESVSADELRGMLRLRRLEARDRIEQEGARLARVESRLRRIEEEDTMPDYDVIVKPMPAQRCAVRTARARAFDQSLGEILPRLYGDLTAQLASHGIAVAGPSVAWYEDSDDDALPIGVIAGLPIDTGDVPADVAERTLPAAERAATTVHRGSMDDCVAGYEALLRWAEDTGERIEGYGREIYLECDGPPDTWVTELQFVLGPRDIGRTVPSVR
ncbi:MAG TPA: MerR family transcriptional regulator [Acidimicrobiia bacterium]|nr:MerR family transcriptional regulator [Acidimicrobiia bacterium]